MLLSDGAFRERVAFAEGDTDAFGRVDARAVLRQFETVATHHFDALNLGRNVAVENGCFWAAVRTALDVAAPPPVGEALILDTWPGRQSHGLYLRHYVLFGEDGTVFLRGLSTWVLVDIESRTLSNNRDWVTHPGGISRPGEMDARQRFKMPPDLPNTAFRTVTAEETDINGHMNNAEYPRWGAEVLPADFARAHRLRRMWI